MKSRNCLPVKIDSEPVAKKFESKVYRGVKSGYISEFAVERELNGQARYQAY